MKAFAEFLPWFCMPSDGVVLCRDAQLLRTARVKPHDMGFAEESYISSTIGHIKSSFKYLGAGWHVYVTYFRRRSDKMPVFFNSSAPEVFNEFEAERARGIPVHYHTESYITLVFTPPELKKTKNFTFNGDNTTGMDYVLYNFEQTTNDIFSFLKSAYASIEPLGRDQVLTFLKQTFSPDSKPVRSPPHGYFLNNWVSRALDDVRLKDHGTHLEIGDYTVLTASVMDYPEYTRAMMLFQLLEAEIEFNYTVRFSIVSREQASGLIKGHRSSHFKRRKGMGALVAETATKEASQLEDTEAVALANDAGVALSTLANGDVFFGYIQNSIVVFDKNYVSGLEKLKKLRSILNDRGVIAKAENLYNQSVFFGSLPGNTTKNVKQHLVQTGTLYHFFPLCEVWQGSFANSHLAEYYLKKDEINVSFPHLIGLSGGSLFFLNLNFKDVGHTLILGPTGSGKSVLLGALAIQWFRYEGARVFFFDKDKSSRAVCLNCGGVFYDLASDDSPFLLNPFYEMNEGDAQYIAWMGQFFIDYFTSKGLVMGPSQELEIQSALVTMSHDPVEHRSFSGLAHLLQVEELRDALEPFSTGNYANLFYTGPDSFADNPFVTFEMNLLMQKGAEIVAFVLSYLFYKVEAKLKVNGPPTLLILDEAWLMLEHPMFSSKIREWLKVLRKKNVYVILATQEIDDAKNTIFSTISNACNTKILLPNPQAQILANRVLYKEIGLGDTDIATLSRARPKHDYFFFSPEGKQLFTMALTKKQLEILKEVRR